MKSRLRNLLLMTAAVFAFGVNASIASAQDMAGMNMPKPKAKPKAKQTVKAKPKAKAKTAAKAKPKTPKSKPKARPNAKPTEKMNMPMPSPTPTPMDMPMPKSSPSPSPTPMPMPMDMPMPKSSPSPSPTAMPMEMPMNMPMPAPTVTPSPGMPMEMPMPTPLPTVQPTPKPMDMDMPPPTPLGNPPRGDARKQTTLGNLSPGEDFGEPVADNERYGSTLFDVLEFRPGRNGNSDFLWDIEGWYGTDKNRFFYKTEGEQNANRSEYNVDLQLLYARLISPYFNFQTGIRFEARKYRGTNIVRPHAVFGFEGLAPYFIRLESGIFIDPKGKVSGRLTLTKDYLLTQRLIMQARFETSAAIQQVERFGTGRGLNDMEIGFRFRYEMRRKFAPYVGVVFAQSFFGTADLVRQEGGNPGQIRFVTGVRTFF